MNEGKGDRSAQRRRHRDRYRGCRICGIRGESCSSCDDGAQLVALHGYAHLVLIVDGSFVAHDRNVRRSSGWGGAGLVLVKGAKILASRACGFLAKSSTDAERHAVIRGARWAPGVLIYTDVRDLPASLEIPSIHVQYLLPGQRSVAHDLAHRLSVEGRCRDAPPEAQTDLQLVERMSGLTKRQRLRERAEMLIERARAEPDFDGDFAKIAEALGWNSGPSWRKNPAIRIAAEHWKG